MARQIEGLTKTQQDRLVNLSERIFDKVEGTFGQTAEDTWRGSEENLGTGIATDEEAHRTMEVMSRGVRYRIIVTAGRAD